MPVVCRGQSSGARDAEREKIRSSCHQAGQGLVEEAITIILELELCDFWPPCMKTDFHTVASYLHFVLRAQGSPGFGCQADLRLNPASDVSRAV